MDHESPNELLIRAQEAYRRVDTDPKRWERHVGDLVVEARQAGDAEALSYALRVLGWSARMHHDHGPALRALNEAVRIAARHRLDGALGAALVTRAAIHQERGQLAAAGRDFDRASTLLPDDVEVMSQRAVLYANLGRISEAEKLHARILGAPSAPLGIRTKSANNLALLLAMKGRFSESLTLFDTADKGAAEMGPVAVAMVTENRAWVTVQAGYLSEGIALFDRAEQLWDESGLPLGELYAEYCDALEQLQLLPEALERAERASLLLHSRGIELMAAEAELRIARLAALAGYPDRAVEAAESAARHFRQQHRATWTARADLATVEARLMVGASLDADLSSAHRAARTLHRRGMTPFAVDAFLTTGRVAFAVDRPNQAAKAWLQSEMLSRDQALLVRLKGKLAGALAAQLAGQRAAVRRLTRSGLSDLAQHRAALPSTELRALASRHGAELGQVGLAARLGSDAPAQVLEWMEQTRAAALSIVENEHSADIEDEIGELRSIYTELVAARQETGTEPPELRARQTRVEQRIRAATWGKSVAGAHTTAALAAPSLRRALGGRTLIEYDLLDDTLVAAVLEPRRTRIVRLCELKTVQQDVESLLFNLRFLSARSDALAASGMYQTARIVLDRLRAELLDPLGLAPSTELVVVPVSKLHALPWAALHDGPVAVSPSGSMWARSSTAQPAAGSRIVLTAGPELPGAEREVATLAELHADPVVLRSGESTMAAVAQAFDDAALAHIACHCFIRGDNPTFSSLLLSDGYLTVHELDLRSDVPHRVILAACESGRDVSYEGNELLGFVSTLMARGAAGVLASAVLVPDEDLLPLMAALHEGIIDGQTLTQALHGARATLDPNDSKQFVAWCAFNAYGAA